MEQTFAYLRSLQRSKVSVFTRTLLLVLICLLSSLEIEAQQGQYYNSWEYDYSGGFVCDIFYEYEDGKLAWMGPNEPEPGKMIGFYGIDALGAYSIGTSDNRLGRRSFMIYVNCERLCSGIWCDPKTRDNREVVAVAYWGDKDNGRLVLPGLPRKELDRFGDGTARFDSYPGGWSSLCYWELPPEIKSIADNAFKTSYDQRTYYHTSDWSWFELRGINLDNIESIGNEAFYNCAKLCCQPFLLGLYDYTRINLTNASLIGTNAFYNCVTIPSVTLYHNIDPNGEHSQFSACTGLTEVIFTGDATRIPANCFLNCTGITTAEISDITEFGNNCFDGCTSLHFDMLEMQGKTIGTSPFGGVSVDWMHIKNTTIADGAGILDGMVNSNIYIEEPTMQTYSKYIQSGLATTDTIYVPRAVWQDYQTDSEWKVYKKQIKPIPGLGDSEEFYVKIDGGYRYEHNGVVYAISGNKELTLVDLGSGNKTGGTLEIPEKFLYGGDYYYVKAVGNDAYPGVCQNTGFTNVVLPSSVTSLCDNVFKNSTSLTTINLGSVTKIGTTGFSGCTSLSAIDLSSATEIGTSAFNGCTSLATATMGSSLTSIPEKSFFNCSALSSIDLSHLQAIGESAFQSCTSLHTINLAAATSNTSLGVCAFQGCTDLAEVSLNSSLRVLPDSIFKNCANLAIVNLGDLYTIGASAFLNCSSLTSIDIASAGTLGTLAFSASGVTEVTTPSSLGPCEQAFKNCLQLTKVTLNGEYVGKETFKGCTALGEVDLSNLSNFSLSLDNEAFASCTSLDTLDFRKIYQCGDFCFDNCTSLNAELSINDDDYVFLGKEPFRGVAFSLIESSLVDLYDYDSSTGDRENGTVDNAILSGVVNSTIHFTDKDNLYNVTEYLKKDEDTGKYVIDENTYIYVHRDIWQTYQDDEGGWQDVKDNIKTWPPYDYYVFKDDEKYYDVKYEPNSDGENTLTLTYVNRDIQYSVIKLEIPDTMTLTHKGTGETTTFTVTRIGDKYTEDGDDYGVLYGFDFQKVILPSTLKQIGNSAFLDCSNLEEINLDSVKVYGDYAFDYCYNMAIHLDLRNATSIGEQAFADCGLKSAWVGKATGEYMFANPYKPLNIYIFEEDPTQVNAEHVTYGLGEQSVVYVVCRNITSPEPGNTNPLQLFYENASWGNNGENTEVWKYVYPMLHKGGNAIEREKTYTTFCFDKPLDFRGTNSEGYNLQTGYYGDYVPYEDWKNYYWWGEYEEDEYLLADRYANDDLALRGMLQFYKQPENNTGGFINNRIEALAVTGFEYTQVAPGTPESGAIGTAPAGIRPAGTGVLVHWHSDEYHGGTGMTEYYPIPPVRDANGNRWTEEGFRAFFSNCNDTIRTGTYENNAGLTNCGGRNLERLDEKKGEYKDNYEGGTTTYNTTTGKYIGSGYDNLMIGNTVRIDSVFYNPWYYAWATKGETGEYEYDANGKHVIDHNNKSFDDNYKQFGLNPSCYFRRFYIYDEYGKKTGSFMRAYRAYLRLPLKITGETENTNSDSPLLINAEFVIDNSLDFSNQGGTTNVINVNTNGNVNDGRYYTLDGRMLQGKPTQKGVYIFNGKKVVVK